MMQKQRTNGPAHRTPGRIGARLLVFLSAVTLLFGCAPAGGEEKETELRTVTVFAMDTVMDVTVCGGPDSLTRDAETLIRELEAAFSVTDPDSEIYAVNETGGGPVGRDTEALLRDALTLVEEKHV